MNYLNVFVPFVKAVIPKFRYCSNKLTLRRSKQTKCRQNIKAFQHLEAANKTVVAVDNRDPFLWSTIVREVVGFISGRKMKDVEQIFE